MIIMSLPTSFSKSDNISFPIYLQFWRLFTQPTTVPTFPQLIEQRPSNGIIYSRVCCQGRCTAPPNLAGAVDAARVAVTFSLPGIPPSIQCSPITIAYSTLVACQEKHVLPTRCWITRPRFRPKDQQTCHLTYL